MAQQLSPEEGQRTKALQSEVLQLLQAKFPDAKEAAAQPGAPKIEIEFQGACEAPKLGITIVSGEFAGKKRIEKHRMVNDVLTGLLNSGRLHAVSYKLEAPEETK